MQTWAKSIDEIEKAFSTDKNSGLSEKEAILRLRKNGANVLTVKKQTSNFKLLAHQFTSTMVLILFAASLIALAKKEYADALLILIIIVANGLISFFQERKAERMTASLAKMLVAKAVVIRGGGVRRIVADQLVVGDLIKLEAGDRVGADARVIYEKNLRVNQAVLTGESMPVVKTAATLPDNTGLLDRKNMVYASTLVTSGRALAIVTDTAMETEVGKIANEINKSAKKVTIFQNKVEEFGRYLVLAAIISCGLVFVIGVWRGLGIGELFGTSLSLLVSVVPEQLPLAITIALSVGLVSMARKKAVIRDLSAVETLGSATVICADKTGTITEGQMTVDKILFENVAVEVSGEYLSLHGDFTEGEKKISPQKDKRLAMILEMACLSSRATVSQNDLRSGKANLTTDPTETALMIASARGGYYAFEEKDDFPEVYEIAFDERHRLSASSHKNGNQYRLIVKGAPEKILEKSKSYIDADGRVRVMSKQVLESVKESIEKFASQTYRLVALGYKDESNLKKYKADEIGGLTLVGIFAIDDPIRAGVNKAIAEAEQAGIRVIMATGDFLPTAKSIASQINLAKDDQVVLASELSSEDLADVRVIARATPSDKYALVNNLQEDGEVVAMTGDGVNDAPALKKSDIGIAIGRGGTDVAIESADMVLLDNKLQTIIAAVREGRLVWENIQKIVLALTAGSIGQLTMVLVGVAVGLPLPLVATQILWTNLVTEGVTVLPLAFEKEESDLMSRPPRSPKAKIMDLNVALRMAFLATFMAIGCLFVYVHYLDNGLLYAQTAVLITACYFEWVILLASRSSTKSVFQIKIKDNLLVWYSLVLALALQILAVYSPFLSGIIKLQGVDFKVWIVGAVVALSALVADEIRKIFIRLAIKN